MVSHQHARVVASLSSRVHALERRVATLGDTPANGAQPAPFHVATASGAATMLSHTPAKRAQHAPFFVVAASDSAISNVVSTAGTAPGPPPDQEEFDPTALLYAVEAGKNLEHYQKIVKYWSSAKCEECNAATLEALGIAPVVGGCALDLGCGDGRYSMWLHDSFSMHVDGIDLSSNRVAVAVNNRNKRRLVAAALDFRVGDLSVWLGGRHGRPWRADGGCDDGVRPTGAPGYDLIAFFDVLEHLVKPRAVLKLSMQQLAPGGFIVGALPIDKPGGTHLQTFRSQEEVEVRLSPTFCVRDLNGKLSGPPADGKVVLCRWDQGQDIAGDDDPADVPTHRPTQAPVADLNKARTVPPQDNRLRRKFRGGGSG